MASLKARLGHVEAERAQLAARLEYTGRRAEADLQRLSSTLCEQVSASNLQQVSVYIFLNRLFALGKIYK